MRKKIFLMQVLISFFCLFFLKTYVIDIRKVSGNSMEPFIIDGQFIIIWKLAYGIPLFNQDRYIVRWALPQKNDIVFYAVEGRYVIKRCVQTEGHTLRFSVHADKNAQNYGLLYIDSTTVPLTLKQFKNLGGFLPETVSVPEGFILTLGDNTGYSHDSRDYGFVSVNSICGKLIWK